jgi:hypothetical protein
MGGWSVAGKGGISQSYSREETSWRPTRGHDNIIEMNIREIGLKVVIGRVVTFFHIE